jgi:hypothetical protein
MIRRAAISALLIILTIAAPVFAAGQEWIILETGYLTICYMPGADLDAVESNLRKRATYFTSEMPGEDAPVEEKVRYQLDALFRRAEELLDMYPANVHVKIMIFTARADVEAEYVKIFGTPAPVEEYKSGIKSFYVHKFNTIYISEEDMSDSIIAHEMAHAIVDHYFNVIPPEKIRELLASYVDLHLAE